MARALTAILMLFLSRSLPAAELHNSTLQAWDQYLKWANAKVRQELSDQATFLIQNGLRPAQKAEALSRIESGGIFVDKMTGVIPPGTRFKVPDGIIHHWWGAVLLRNVTLPQLFQFLQDYDHHAGKFADVERSKLELREGNHYKVFFRFRRTKFITAVYNTEQDCHYTSYGPDRAASDSVATRIAQVADPGERSEHEMKPGDDGGYLWRLASWWRYEQRGKDVIVELESASLSRDIPWIVNAIPGLKGYINSTPRESLESVLASIRKNVK
jgi:hypothetical protein